MSFLRYLAHESWESIKYYRAGILAMYIIGAIVVLYCLIV